MTVTEAKAIQCERERGPLQWWECERCNRAWTEGGWGKNFRPPECLERKEDQ